MQKPRNACADSGLGRRRAGDGPRTAEKAAENRQKNDNFAAAAIDNDRRLIYTECWLKDMYPRP